MSDASRRRAFPARLFLPHEPRRSPAFHAAEVAAIMLPLPLFYAFMFAAARVRYWRRMRGLRGGGAPPPAPPGWDPPSPAEQELVRAALDSRRAVDLARSAAAGGSGTPLASPPPPLTAQKELV